MKARLAGVHGISLLEPCGHDELIRRMCGATLVLSDFGGIQEEAPALGVPLLVLRDKTERPEGIESGSSRLVGTATRRIVEEVERLLDDQRRPRRNEPPVVSLRRWPGGATYRRDYRSVAGDPYGT